MINNSDMIINIANYLDIIDHKNLCFTNRDNLLLLFEHYIIKYNNKKQFILTHYVEIIIALMGGLKKMMTYPILHWKPRFLGSTNYIDSIMAEDVYAPIMLGIDIMDRAYITIRTKQTFRKKSYYIVNTLFKRYTDDNSWTQGTYYPMGKLFVDESGYFYNSNNPYKFSHTLVHINIYQLLNNKDYIFGYRSINFQTQELVTYDVSLY